MAAAAAVRKKEVKGLINLGKGHPAPSLLPLKEVSDAVNAAAGSPKARDMLMQYGAHQGSMRFRALLSDWLARETGRADAVPRPAHLLATTGAGPALCTIAQLFTSPGETIFVDGPGYMRAYYAFADARLNVVNVPTDEHGLCTDAVARLIADGQRPSLVYTVPIANNPTGVSMSEERKRHLVELSHKHDFKIASDEVYQFLCFHEGVPTSLFEFDDPDKPSVFAISSFSKILGPGLRLGWVATHEAHMKRLVQQGAIQSGGGLNPFMCGAVSELLSSGFVGEQAARLRRVYGANSEATCGALDAFVAPALRGDERLEFYRPVGGFFVFVRLPPRFDCERLLERAKGLGVAFLSGLGFSADGRGFANCLRICFAYYDADTLVQGVRLLGDAVAEYE